MTDIICVIKYPDFDLVYILLGYYKKNHQAGITTTVIT